MEGGGEGPAKHVLHHYDPAVIEMGKAYKLAVETGASQNVVDSIRRALQLVELREDFTHSSTSQASEACKNILDTTMTTDWKTLKDEGKTKWFLKPVMMTGHLEGEFLKSVVSMHKAKRVLDIGMFTGYSALAMAESLPADGEMVTVDMDPFLEKFTGDLFKKSPHGGKIKIRIGNALEILKELSGKGEKFDVIFLDADKSEYIEYLKLAYDQNMLSAGGSILVDNAFRHGAGYNEEETNPSKLFAKFLEGRTDLHRCLVPLRDGIVMVRRLSDVEGATS